MTLLAVVLGGGLLPAGAQTDDEIYETCSLYNTILSLGGGPAVDAIADLRSRAAPNPPGVDDAFDVLNAFEDDSVEDPSSDDVDAATETLMEYYDPICLDIDPCSLLAQVNGNDPDHARRGADWLDRLSAPSPPGIGAALSVLSGRIEPEDTSGLVDDVDAARETVNAWFGGNCRLAITGRTDSFPLTMIGLGAVVIGTTLVIVNRRDVF